jgi:hypothetical protein
MLTYTSEQDLPIIIKTLNTMFHSVTHNLRNPSREAADGSASLQLYKWQVEYAYKLNDIVKCPNYIKPKVINNCVDFIHNVDNTLQQTVFTVH